MDNKLEQKTKQIMQGKYEIAIIVLKPGKKVSFDLYKIVKSMEKAIEIRNELQNKGYLVRLVKKSKGGNKHNSAYLSDFGKSIFVTIGINRVLEANIKQLREKLYPQKNYKCNKKETSGYMAFAYHMPTTTYVCTRLYETETEAIEFINKRWGIDKDSIDVVDTSRLTNGSFRFSKKDYEDCNRLKNVKQHKLINKFGKQEAYAMIELLEEKRQELYDSRQKALELIEESGAKETDKEIVEDPAIEKNYQYITELVEKIRDIQRNINEGNKEILELESSFKDIDSKLLNAKDFSNKANDNAIQAQKILQKILSNTKDSDKIMYN